MTLQTVSTPWPLVDGLYRSPALSALGVVAAFTPAALGSMGGSVFSQEEQAANRDAVARRCGFPAVVRVKQIHGNRIVYAPFVRPDPALPAPAEPSSEEPWPAADGLWTDRPEVLLGVSAADCAPLLIADGEGRIGAAHAGWEGTTQRIAHALVRALVSAGAAPERLVAAIGPAIGPCCYTVGEERAALIRDRLGVDGSAALRSGDEGPVFDVPCANAAQLAAAGVRAIELSGMCTRCGEGELWSYRSRGERGPQGTGAALIGRLS